MKEIRGKCWLPSDLGEQLEFFFVKRKCKKCHVSNMTCDWKNSKTPQPWIWEEQNIKWFLVSFPCASQNDSSWSEKEKLHNGLPSFSSLGSARLRSISDFFAISPWYTTLLQSNIQVSCVMANIYHAHSYADYPYFFFQYIKMLTTNVANIWFHIH